MDGRGRQSSNSGPASTVPLIPPYYPGNQAGTVGTGGSGGFVPNRERFWGGSGSGRPTSPPDPWSSSVPLPPSSYMPQLLPLTSNTENYSSGGTHLNIPYPSGGTNGNIPTTTSGGLNNGTTGSGGSDLTSSSPYPGPSPPHQVLSSGYGGAGGMSNNSTSPRSSSRQYTPSTTPTGPLNGINGNSHSSNDSPPTSGGFEGYMNGTLDGKNGSDIGASHPNDLPGYLPPSASSSGRYPGDIKTLDGSGEMIHSYHHHHHHHQQQQQQSYYHQNYYPQQSSNSFYYDSSYQSGGRRPFDPYQPYPNNQQTSASSVYTDNSYISDSSGYTNTRPREMSKHDENAGPSKLDGKDGFEDETNFDVVLHGYGTDNGNRFNSSSYGGSSSDQRQYDLIPSGGNAGLPGGGTDKPESLKSDSNSPPGKSPGSNGSKKEKGKKRSPKGHRSSNDTEPESLRSDEDDGGGRDNSKHSSPKSISKDGQGETDRKLDERSHHSVSSGGEGGGSSSTNNSPPTLGPGEPKSNSNSSSCSIKKKKPWKKVTTKPINSEQLLEERERHCAEYVESTERTLVELGHHRDTKAVKVKEEIPSPYYPPHYHPHHHHHHYEERNITIDHQKEAEILKKEIEDKGSGMLGKDSQSENSSHATTDEDEVNRSGEKKKDVPMVECGCFPVDEVHPEPGPFYTHLGAAHSLHELRQILEHRTGFRGVQLRFEKIIYTGKEGKTSQGCPLAKWIIRRGTYEEQLLFLVKHRKGHKCATAWIIVCCVIWEAVPHHFADNIYDTMVYKLNRFGIPTTRRSDTNEQRSCACQGVDPDTCGAAYSFGCAWSMFFNGCKYARSRNVRKFRLTEEHEEAELEEKVSHLATHLAPLYERVASDSYRNQIEHENEGLECRLGFRPGRPFSGVTACVDYCSHAHKDAHNMINGCTVTVAFTRNRSIAKGDDEQYHVLPLYKLDDTDEFGSKEGQKQKVKKGQLEILKKFPSKVRIRKVPLLPSRRRGKVKPPSGNSSSSSSHHHHHHSKSMAGDLYGTPGLGTVDHHGHDGSLSMPLPMKREKLSIFDELNSAAAGGTDLFDSRFHHPHHPGPPPHFSNLLMSKSHSKLGMGIPMSMSLEDHLQSSQISSSTAVLDPDGTSSTLWNLPPYGNQANPGHHGQPPPGPFRSYFDSNQVIPTALSTQGSSSQYPTGGASGFGHNLDLGHGSTSSRAGSSSSTIQNSGTVGGNGGLLSPTQGNNANNANNLGNASGSSGNSGGSGPTTPSYTSMSPSSILPSFRHTFMTEAESLSMLSAMSSPAAGNSGSGTGGSPPDPGSNSARGSGKSSSTSTVGGPGSSGSSGQTSNASPLSSGGNTSGSFGESSLGYSNSSSGYFTSSSSSSGTTPPYSGSANSSLYHPQAHHATPGSSCLSGAPSSQSGSGSGSFNTNYSQRSTSFAPPPSLDPHHPVGPFGGMSPMASAWNTPVNSGYSHSAYGAAQAPPPYHTHHNQMPHFQHMNQYSPYTNQAAANFMTPSTMAAAAMVGMHHPHQHPPPNPWASPLSGFGSPHPMTGHHHPPPPPPSCFVAPPKPKVIPEVNENFSDNEEAFKDSSLGGVAIAMTHGSVILQCAKHEMHSTTSLKAPNRLYPSRICLVFYQHKSMNNRFHGWSEWEKKIEAKKLQEVKLINQGKMEASPRKMKQLIKEGYIPDN